MQSTCSIIPRMLEGSFMFIFTVGLMSLYWDQNNSLALSWPRLILLHSSPFGIFYAFISITCNEYFHGPEYFMDLASFLKAALELSDSSIVWLEEAPVGRWMQPCGSVRFFHGSVWQCGAATYSGGTLGGPCNKGSLWKCHCDLLLVTCSILYTFIEAGFFLVNVAAGNDSALLATRRSCSCNIPYYTLVHHFLFNGEI